MSTFTVSRGLLRLMSIEPMMPPNRLILCHPLLLMPSIFPNIRSFPMSQLFESDGQSVGASVSASVFPMNIQGWFPLGLTCLISLLSKGLSRVFSSITVQKHQFFSIVRLDVLVFSFIHSFNKYFLWGPCIISP